MTREADGYNATEFANSRLKRKHVVELLRRAGQDESKPGRVTPSELTVLVERFQAEQNLHVDGKAGPVTRAMIELLAGRVKGDIKLVAVQSARSAPEVAAACGLEVSTDGWLQGEGVTRIAMHPSWHYARLKTDGSEPAAIVAHYSATPHGTALAMAKRRAVKIDLDSNDGDGVDRQASWHVSIEGDGSIVQMASFKVGCWHAGGATAKPIPGLGAANHYSVGIELIGDGSSFPEAQVAAAKRVWRALVAAYRIPRDRAMIGHSWIDPTRKRDPGPVWTAEHADDVLRAAGL